MSDIEFLSKKEFDGKLRTAEGNVTAAGDVATITANTGKDMYIATAKVVFISEVISNAGATGDEVVIKINGVIKETVKNSWSAALTSNGGKAVLTSEYEFKNMGLKVAAGQIIKLEAITLDPDTQVEGFISCFEEPTGGDPTI